MSLDYFLERFHKATESEVTAEKKDSAPSLPPPDAPPLRPCDFNPDHPAYPAVWLPANRTRAGRWEVCPLCKQEWAEQFRHDQRLLNLLLGEPVWTKQAFRER
jgi:hypothetical protein